MADTRICGACINGAAMDENGNMHTCRNCGGSADAPPEEVTRMTVEHWENLVTLDARALTKTEAQLLREVAEAVHAIAVSGTHAVYDTRTHRVVSRDELADVLGHLDAWYVACKGTDEADEVWGEVTDAMHRWLSDTTTDREPHWTDRHMEKQAVMNQEDSSDD